MKEIVDRVRRFVRSHETLVVLTGIALAAVVVHLPLLFGSFIDYDDQRQIYLNLIVKNFTWKNFVNVLSTNFAGKGAAPSFLLSMFNWYFTPNYAGFAAFNIGWLVATVFVFYRFSGLFLREKAFRYVATLFFAVHSVNADTYGWMSARCHILGCPFALMCLIMWQKYQDELYPVSRVKWYVLALLSTAVAVWNKGIYFMIPPLVVVYDLYRNRRLSLISVIDKIPVTAIAVLPLFYAPLKRDIGALEHPAMGSSLTSTLLNDAGLVMEYLYRLLIPGHTTVCVDVYPVDGLYDISTDASLLFMRMPPIFNIFAISLIVASAVWMWGRFRAKTPFFALLFIGVALAPVMNIPPRWVEFGYRFELMPSTFFSVAFACVAGFIWQRATNKAQRLVVAAVVALLITSHGAFSFLQSMSWRTNRTYWEACLESHPDALLCRNKLAIDLQRAKWPLAKVAEQYKIVHDYTRLRKPKRAPNTAERLANIYTRMGRYEDAIFYYERSLLTEHHKGNRLRDLRKQVADLKTKIRRNGKSPRR